jgi:hypothetical protein
MHQTGYGEPLGVFDRDVFNGTIRVVDEVTV